MIRGLPWFAVYCVICFLPLSQINVKYLQTTELVKLDQGVFWFFL